MVKQRRGRVTAAHTHGDVIKSVEIGEGLGVSLVLNELLCSTVQKTDMLQSFRQADRNTASSDHPSSPGRPAEFPHHSARELNVAHRERQGVGDWNNPSQS